MINKEEEFYFDVDPMEELNQEAHRIFRIKSTLQYRLNLINLFKSSIDKNYVKLTLKNIEIDTESENEMTNFIIKNNKDIIGLKKWFDNNGSVWQKERLSKSLKD